MQAGKILQKNIFYINKKHQLREFAHVSKRFKNTMLKRRIQLIRDTFPSFLFKLSNGVFTDKVKDIEEAVSQNRVSYELVVLIELGFNNKVSTDNLVIFPYYYGQDGNRIDFMGVTKDTTKAELLE